MTQLVKKPGNLDFAASVRRPPGSGSGAGAAVPWGFLKAAADRSPVRLAYGRLGPSSPWIAQTAPWSNRSLSRAPAHPSIDSFHWHCAREVHVVIGVKKSRSSEGFRAAGTRLLSNAARRSQLGGRRLPEWRLPVGGLLQNGDLQAIPRICEKKLKPPQLTKETQ